MPDKWEFENEEIKVTWEKNVCIHAAACVGNLPGVFKPGQKPWIQLDGSDADKVKETIGKCPSGALHFEKKS